MKIGVGIIGTGSISRAHAQAYLKLPEQVQLVAVADISEERARGRTVGRRGLRPMWWRMFCRRRMRPVWLLRRMLRMFAGQGLSILRRTRMRTLPRRQGRPVAQVRPAL